MATVDSIIVVRVCVALARALGLLYEDQLTVSSDEVISLLAAASLLAYPELERE